MKISKQALRETRQLFRGCQVNGRLDEARVRQAVALAINRTGLVERVLSGEAVAASPRFAWRC